MNISDIFNIENWEKASFDYLSDKQSPNSFYCWQNINKVLSPLSLYKLLKAKFGAANGLSMLFKAESTENLIHWHYTFIINKNLIHIIGKSSGIEILLSIENDIEFNSSDWQILFTNIKNAYGENGKRMNEVLSEFQKYTLFINPFTRLKDTINNTVNELKSLDTKEIERINKLTSTSEEITEYYMKYQCWIKNVERAVTLGTTLRMLCPVLAESFINILILIFAKEEFKKDNRLYENLIRQQIDIRTKTLHINCNGFIKPIDSEAKEFKDFQTLMNNRNDFLHGNIDPTKLMFEDVYFDLEYIPLFKEDEGIITKTMKNYLRNVETENAIKDYNTACSFVEFILSHIDEEYKGYIEHLLITRMPGYNNKTKGIAILFPIELVET